MVAICSLFTYVSRLTAKRTAADVYFGAIILVANIIYAIKCSISCDRLMHDMYVYRLNRHIWTDIQKGVYVFVCKSKERLLEMRYISNVQRRFLTHNSIIVYLNV